MPERENDDEIEIKLEDLKIDTYRSSVPAAPSTRWKLL